MRAARPADAAGGDVRQIFAIIEVPCSQPMDSASQPADWRATERENNRLRSVTQDLTDLRREAGDISLRLSVTRDKVSERLLQLSSWQVRARRDVTGLAKRSMDVLPPPEPLAPTVLQDSETMHRQEMELVRWIAWSTKEPDMQNCIPDLMRRFPTMKTVVRERLLLRIVAEITANEIEHSRLIPDLWRGLPGPPPKRFDAETVSALPAALRAELENKWAEICVQRWCHINYGPLVEKVFQDRQELMAQVLYRMIRVADLPHAQEIHLQLAEDNMDFMELARLHSEGEERLSHGLVGPVALEDVHASIQDVLLAIPPGSIHGPIEVHPWYIILKSESKIPAVLDERTRALLLDTMLDEDLEAVLNGQNPPHAWQFGSLNQ